MTVKHAPFGFALVLMIALPGRLAAVEPVSLQQRVERLEQQVSALSSQVRSLQAQIQAVQSTGSPGHKASQGGESDPQKDRVGRGGVSFFGIHSWLVEVLPTEKADDSGLLAQLDKTRLEITSINEGLEKALRHHREVSRQRSEFDLYQGQEVLKNVYPDETIRQAKQAVLLWQQQQRTAQTRLAGLQRRNSEGRGVGPVMGRMSDGRSVRLIAEGAAARLVADMQPGQWYEVTGTSNTQDSGVVNISVQSVTGHAEP